MVKDMKVIVISGSPRKDANTQIIMKYVFEYAKSRNQDTKLINLSD
ncbi:MAG: NAD(P)H-dependent oxidoreductase, partial [Nitrosopumilus sp.]